MLTQAELLKHEENIKLQALELEGLIDTTPESAVWVGRMAVLQLTEI